MTHLHTVMAVQFLYCFVIFIDNLGPCSTESPIKFTVVRLYEEAIVGKTFVGISLIAQFMYSDDDDDDKLFLRNS